MRNFKLHRILTKVNQAMVSAINWRRRKCQTRALIHRLRVTRIRLSNYKTAASSRMKRRFSAGKPTVTRTHPGIL